MSKYWTYSLTKKEILYYTETNILEKKIVVKYDDFSDKDTNKEKQEIYKYFEDNYLRKYIY